jgi:hypothetical protein
MKKLIRFLVFAVLVATLALPVLAQTPTTPNTSSTAPTQDETQAKADLYAKFRDNIKTNPPVAYEAGKEYLQKYEAADGPTDQYVSYIKKWVTAYDKVARRNVFAEQLKAKNYNEAFATGKAILADNAEDLPILYDLARAGFVANDGGNKANNADTVAYAKKTLSLIQAGRTFETGKPIANKDEIVSLLNYGLGVLLQESQPADAMNYLISAAQFEGFAKKDPRTYIFLADIYEKGEYARLANQFNTNCKLEEQAKTPECVELKGKVDMVVDHVIDSLARAIAYSNSSPNAAQYATARAAWTESLTNYYKYRTGSDTGLKEFIAGITSRPIPKPNEPIVPPIAPSTPASTTTPAQPTGTGSNTAPSSSSMTTAKPSSTTTTPASTTTQPATKTTTKTTPKRAHASGKRG